MAARIIHRLREGLTTLRRDLLTVPVMPMPPMSRPRALRRLPHVIVIVTALALLPSSAELMTTYHTPASTAVFLVATQSAALITALYRPMLAWWMSVLGALFMTASADPTPSTTDLWPWTVVGLIGHSAVQLLLSLRVRPRVAVQTLVLSLLVIPLPAWHRDSLDRSDSLVLAAVLFTGVTLLGSALRGRREARSQLLAQETLTAEERARRTLLEERGRIARELHDVVAHHMSVISIQAEAAPYRVKDPPEELTRSFAEIRENAVEALHELRRVLGVLRSEEPVAGERAPDAPQPTLERLDELVENVRAAGLRVRLSVSGQVTALPPGVELSAYRVVQEALSNALRHAPGSRVWVEVEYVPEGVRLRVGNSPPDAAPVSPSVPGAGHGLLGMRERVAMLGGELRAGPTKEGGFEVVGFLPRGGEGPGAGEGARAGGGD
ncbi:sensor histidine kinase [Streptomyces sp. NPDC005438]|uniref:sensor histidine kinase n=1 Tax=Streptomyces sp. NPDC005438 TaxID=3156880 RepID=UPI0033B16BB6